MPSDWRSAVAGDTLSASLSAERCAQLTHSDIFVPQGVPFVEGDDCRQAELVDHTDEVVGFRLFAIPLALIGAAGYDLSRRNWFRDAKELQALRRLGLLLGFAAFGLAAAVMFVVVARNTLIDGDTAGLGRWLSDGIVSLAFCLIYGALAARQLRRPSAA